MSWQHDSWRSNCCCGQNSDIINLKLFKLILGRQEYGKKTKQGWLLWFPITMTFSKHWRLTIYSACGPTSTQNIIHLLCCYFVNFVVVRCGLKGNLQAEEECVCRNVSILAVTLRAQILSAQPGESHPGTAESHTFGHTRTHTHACARTHTHITAIHYRSPIIQPCLPPFPPISHGFLYCGAVPDFIGTGPEWRRRITSVHIVYQTLLKQKLPHIKPKHWKCKCSW